MVRITLDTIVPATPLDDGWRVEYRIKDSSDAFVEAVGSPFGNFPIVIDTTDDAGTLYEGRIWQDCGDLESTKLAWETACDCTNAGVGYSVNDDGDGCTKTETISATVTYSDYCLTAANNSSYTNFGSRIYKVGFDYTTLFVTFGNSDTYIHYNMSLSPQWANTTLSLVAGPMNRRSVWIDSDCDGNKDPLTEDAKTTIAFMYNNIGAKRQIFIGISADNDFRLVVNGDNIVDTNDHVGISEKQFKIFHIIPVTLKAGVNYFNGVAKGDGTYTDSIAMVGFDNTALEIKNATNDSQLTRLFDSYDLRGTAYDVAECPDDYSMDTSGGVGEYTCVKIFKAICNKAP